MPTSPCQEFTLIQGTPIFLDLSKDFLFYSFYTNDEYYQDKAQGLKKVLENLQIPHRIDHLIVDHNRTNWAKICRKKISFINKICQDYPDKKIFWIDIDCSINTIPTYITNFSADIIGFYRGFETPLKMGYHLKSRFWEPCFLGFNTSHQARDFINLAAELEHNSSFLATDDYFFEEAWRISCKKLNFQIISSTEKITTDIDTGFFVTGSSGHVSEYSEKVARHTPIYESFFDKVKRKIRHIKRQFRNL